MTTNLLRKLSPIALVCTLGFAVPGDEIAFHPQDGSSLTKKFESSFTLRLADLSVNAMGQEVSPDMMGNPEVTVTASQSIELSDEFVKVSGGRPLELARLFDGLAGKVAFEYSAGGESGTQESELKSELVGKKIAYKWDAKDDKYAITFAEGHDGDAALLEDLEEDMDFRYLLGGGSHKEGETWDVPTDRLGVMLFPGSSFKLKGEDAGNNEEALEMMKSLDIDPDELLAKVFDGTVKAKYAGTKDVDGKKLAEIELTAEIKSSNDFRDLAARLVDKAIEMQGGDVGEKPNFESFNVDLSFKGTGVLMWDTAAGHAHSFELNGEGSLELKIGASVEADGQKMSMKGSAEFEGDFHSALDVSR